MDSDILIKLSTSRINFFASKDAVLFLDFGDLLSVVAQLVNREKSKSKVDILKIVL
ncbi:hypothetical protein [Kordia antarctica]|uniref:hypothetical protein n=1 Tax=Kordia antarctica TaxID=1218801 RepID=UPI0013599C77|nr:hypothetical protein [Kordia antarctica]